MDSLKNGRAQVERSMRLSDGVGNRIVVVVVSGWGWVDCLDLIVSRTNWAIWGQTRGCLVLQIMMPILGGVDIVLDRWV